MFQDFNFSSEQVETFSVYPEKRKYMSMHRSESIDLISEALAKAQGMYKVLSANQATAGGKYANLQAILESCREALSTNGIAFYQYIELMDEGSGGSILKTILSHSSGQFLSSTARIVAGTTFRETFNCVEAFRRLNALLLLGIAPSENDPLIKDDNGIEQQDKIILQNLRKPQDVPARSQFVDVITLDQYEDLLHELEGYEEIAKGIQITYQVTSIADLPRSEFYTVQARVRKLKKVHEEYNRSNN
jgi:hypothetical protein